MDSKTQTPEQWIARAAEGRFTKQELAASLAIERRQPFLDACAAIERQFTVDCGEGTKEPCLESGCSAAGEICLQPLIHAGSAYHKACAGAWLPLYSDENNRA